MASHGFSWLLMASHGFSWLLVASRGFSWLSCLAHRTQALVFFYQQSVGLSPSLDTYVLKQDTVITSSFRWDVKR